MFVSRQMSLPQLLAGSVDAELELSSQAVQRRELLRINLEFSAKLACHMTQP